MQYNGPTFELPLTVPERPYPAGVVVERTLRVWAFSRWRGARGFVMAAGTMLVFPRRGRDDVAQ